MRAVLLLLCAAAVFAQKPVVLTFDDSVKSHRTVVAPLLKELGFRGTFFISEKWMDDKENFLSWEEIGQIQKMGFEIGNHSVTHSNFGSPEKAATLAEELQTVEKHLAAVGVPKPVSFAWCGNGFGPEAVAVLRENGYKYARRGMQPEIPYGEIRVGPAYDPAVYNKLLIPTTGDAYPKWTMEHFKSVLAQSAPGKIVVLQFHGVPDKAHPWVHTPPEMFEQYMRYLKQNGFVGIALADVEKYSKGKDVPNDPMLKVRYPLPAAPK